MAILSSVSLLWTVLLLAQVEPQRAGGIVAVVGDTVVTQAELDRAITYHDNEVLSKYPKPLLEWHRRRREHAELDRLIDEKLVLHRVQIIEKKENKPYITDAHIHQELVRRVKLLNEEGNFAHSVEDIYRQFRDSYGMGRKQARRFLRDQMSIDKFMWREIYPRRVNPWVSPEESRYYYRANVDKFTTPVEISFRHVHIPLSRRDYQVASQAMEQGLKEGKDFVEMARLYSQEALEGRPGEAARVRSYSFEDLATWHHPLPQELRKMKKGEVAGPIVSAIGIHFFKVEDVISGAPEPFSDAHPKIQNILRVQRHRIARMEFIQEERRKTRIKILLPPLPKIARQGGSAAEKGDEGVPKAENANPR